MATKVICDGCKKEIRYWPKDSGHTEVTGHRTRGNTADSHFDLCGDCFMAVIRFINQIK